MCIKPGEQRKKSNPKSFHAFRVFKQILQRSRPFGCALGILVAAAGTPITVVDVCKAKFRLWMWPKDTVILQRALWSSSSPLWLRCNSKLYARIYSPCLTQWIHSSPDNNLMKGLLLFSPFYRCGKLWLPVKKGLVISQHSAYILAPPTCPLADPQAAFKSPSSPPPRDLDSTATLPHYILCTVL